MKFNLASLIPTFIKKRFHPSSSPPQWFTDWAQGTEVNKDSALTFAAVFSAVRIIAETIASLPLPILRRLPDGSKERLPQHPLWFLFNSESNPEMTAYEVRETLIGQVLINGNGFANLVFDGRGNVKEIWPLRSDKMRLTRDENTKELRYFYTLPDGKTVGLSPSEVLHLKFFSKDGLWGMSIIELHKRAIGIGLSAEAYGEKFFTNGVRLSGVLEYPGTLKKEARENLRESWERGQRGLSNSNRMAILEEGMKWVQIGIKPDEAQYIETRKFSVTDVARMFRVPPHMLADLERATFSNVEQQAIDFVVHTVRPWLVRMEQTYRKSCLKESEKRTILIEHVVDGLLRGDIKSRFESYAVARQNGWMSADDVRAKENMNPLPDGQGKIYMVPLNMVPATSLTNPDPEADERNIDDIVKRFSGLVSEAGARVLRREKADILKGGKKFFQRKDPAGFHIFINEFFDKHEAFMTERIAPAFMTLARSVANGIPDEALADLVTTELRKMVRIHSMQGENSLSAVALIEDKGKDMETNIREALDERIERIPTDMAEADARDFAHTVLRFRANAIE